MAESSFSAVAGGSSFPFPRPPFLRPSRLPSPCGSPAAAAPCDDKKSKFQDHVGERKGMGRRGGLHTQQYGMEWYDQRTASESSSRRRATQGISVESIVESIST